MLYSLSAEYEVGITFKLKGISLTYFLYNFLGLGVPGSRDIRPGGQVLEARHLRNRGHQDPEEPSLVRTPGPDRSLDPVPTQPGECRRVQLCAGLRVLPAQEPHLSGLRDAGAEPLRLPQAEQVLATPPQVHTAHSGAGELPSKISTRTILTLPS